MVSYYAVPENVTRPWFWVNHTSTGSANTTGSDDGAVDEEKVAAVALVGPVMTGVVLSVIVLCTVVGNVMVLLAVFVNSHLRSTTNYFIVNLAIADLLLGTTVLPFSASLEVFKVWLFGQLFCDIWAAIDVLCCTASIFSLCVISIDRYIGVTRPLQRSTIMTERRALYIIVFIWLLSMAISIAPLIGWKQPPSPDPYECTVTTQTGYVIFSVSASFYIPLSIILLVYFRIYREAIKHSRFLTTGVKTTKVDESGVTLRVHKGGGVGMTSHLHYAQGQGQNNSPHYNANSNSHCPRASPGHQSSSSSDRSESSVGNKTTSRLTAAGKVARFKRETKAAKTLGIVVGVFILCWFPFFFILPLSSLCEHCHIPDLLFTIFFWLGYCNSLMNPVIYACSSREFQFAFRRILRCQFRRRPRVFLTDQHSERSSSCHDFNQLEGNNTTARGQGGRGTSTRKSKSRKLKFVRTFRSKRSTRRHNEHRPISLQSFNEAGIGGEGQGAGSSTESLRALHRKSGDSRKQCSSGTKYGCSEWSGGGSGTTVRRNSISRDDLFDDLSMRSMYANCGSR